MAKTYTYRQNIGQARHVVSWHNGAKVHSDGSPFFDMSIFKRKKDAKIFIRYLESQGYVAG